jgi:hypothetical protein
MRRFAFARHRDLGRSFRLRLPRRLGSASGDAQLKLSRQHTAHTTLPGACCRLRPVFCFPPSHPSCILLNVLLRSKTAGNVCRLLSLSSCCAALAVLQPVVRVHPTATGWCDHRYTPIIASPFHHEAKACVRLMHAAHAAQSAKLFEAASCCLSFAIGAVDRIRIDIG